MNCMQFFILDRNPLPMQRPRGVFKYKKGKKPNVVFYQTKRDKDYQKELIELLEPQNKDEPYETDIAVFLSFSRKGRQRADVDNLIKNVFDGLNGVAWSDDKIITTVHSDLTYKHPSGEIIMAIVEKSEYKKNPLLYLKKWYDFLVTHES